jgi:hypothetical protein
MNTVLKGFGKNPFVLFLVLWGILNLVQARLTPLNNDEAYYWMYSKHLAWGYFDHPPMIALMIKAGYAFIHNELGVRICVVLSQLVLLWIIWKLTDKDKRKENENIIIFFLIVVLLPVLNLYSVLATPDAPLLLFSAVFLLAYKKFLEDEGWQITIFLGISMAALMYSKYHGALVIIFVILSNLRLLLSKKFFLAVVFGIILFLPHLYWQYSNGFPSLKYHLFDRVSAFNIAHVPQYLVGQFFFSNPFLITLVIWLIVKLIPRNLFQRSLYYIITGFFIFFFFSSFRYRIEPQWTAAVSIPVVILIFDNLDYRPWIRKFVYRTAYFLVPLMLFVRSVVAVDYLDLPILKKEFHNKKQWVSDISRMAGNRPVVFTNSYQRPSVYTFYSGKLAYTLDNLSYRKTQFDIWDFEEQVHGKEVLYVPHYFSDEYKANLTAQVLTCGDTIYTKVFTNFQSFQKECTELKDMQYTFCRNKVNSISLKISNPYPYIINLRHNEFPVSFQVGFIKNGRIEYKQNLKLPDNISFLNPGESFTSDYQFTLKDLPPGKYYIAICSETGILYDTVNSNIRKAVVSD